MGSIFMNISANILGLDNAATMGLKAMKELQEINPHKDRASNPMIMFLVLNSSGLLSFRLPSWYIGHNWEQQIHRRISTYITGNFLLNISGLLSVAIMQKINLFNKTILLTLLGFIAVVAD